MITVKQLNPNEFEVTVTKGSTTTHRVQLTDDYYEKLTGGNVNRERLIEESFKFLLERESNSSIMRSFDLPTIQRYFPEYERDISGRL